jgi:hypothetical protein
MTTQEMQTASDIVKALRDEEIAKEMSAEELIDRAAEFVDRLKNEASLRKLQEFNRQQSAE